MCRKRNHNTPRSIGRSIGFNRRTISRTYVHTYILRMDNGVNRAKSLIRRRVYAAGEGWEGERGAAKFKLVPKHSVHAPMVNGSTIDQ